MRTQKNIRLYTYSVKYIYAPQYADVYLFIHISTQTKLYNTAAVLGAKIVSIVP